MQSEYRAFWNKKMWKVQEISYLKPQTVRLTDGITDYINVPLSDVILMRNTGRQDISGEYVYEGDIIESHQGTQILAIPMLIKYGLYEAYCPEDRECMDNIGFYVEADGYSPMPVGPLSEYAKVIGNVYQNETMIKSEELEM